MNEPIVDGTIRIGIIGLGGMGRHHLSRFALLPNARIVAVADADPQRAQAALEKLGDAPDIYPDGDTLIRQAAVDVVDICAPTYLHAPLAIRAAEAGRHVLTEKPMALNSAEAQQMIDAAQRHGVELMVAQVIRFWPEYLYLRDAVQDGRFGRLLKLELSRSASKLHTTWQDWMNNAARAGGAILDLHIHDADFANFLLGTPQQIYARGFRTPGSGGYDLMTALYTYDGGPEVTLRCAWYETPGVRFKAEYLAVFERAIVLYDPATKPTLTVLPGEGVEPETLDVSGDAYHNEMKYFVDALCRGESPAQRVSPESVRRSLQLVEWEVQSIETMLPVRP